MATTHVIKLINEELNSRARFHSHDFLIQDNESNTRSDPKIEIKYRYDTQYFCILTIPSKVNTRTYSARIKPGDLNMTEDLQGLSENQLFLAIRSWLSYLDRELDNIPQMRELVSQREAIASLEESLEDLSDKAFTRDEMNRVLSKLEALQKQLNDEMINRISDKKEQEAQLKSLHADFEAMRKNLEIMNKKNWASSTILRLKELTKNPKLLEKTKTAVDIIDKVKGFLE